MGYTTDFTGHFTISPPLSGEHYSYLQEFATKRHMRRDPLKAEMFEDVWRSAVSLPIGTDGAYFVAGKGVAGQDHDDSITDYNQPPEGQPGLWCHWMVINRSKLIWNGMEKFYNYEEWLRYLIEHFFDPWGYVLNGSVDWQGEDSDDKGELKIADNRVVATRNEEAEEESSE